MNGEININARSLVEVSQQRKVTVQIPPNPAPL